MVGISLSYHAYPSMYLSLSFYSWAFPFLSTTGNDTRLQLSLVSHVYTHTINAIEKVIGKGAFGKVHLVQHKGTLLEYALKCIHKDKCVELRAANNMISERRLLERINYPLIVNLRYAFQDDDHLFMVLDLMLGGDLRFQLERNGPLSELQVRFYVAEIALSLAYLHRRRIAHR